MRFSGTVCRQSKCPLTDEWIKKMWCTYTVEYYSAMKKNKTLFSATTWRNLKDVTLSEISQRKRSAM